MQFRIDKTCDISWDLCLTKELAFVACIHQLLSYAVVEEINIINKKRKRIIVTFSPIRFYCLIPLFYGNLNGL